MNIKTIYNCIHDSLFTDGTLTYPLVTESIVMLANLLNDEDETDETTWSIGEGGCADLGSLIVGAYWFYTDYHDGQWSMEYTALCALGTIFSPGKTTGPEIASEQEVYEALESMCPY